MCKGVVSFSEINPADVENHGGKSTNLARLYQSGFNVPSGFSISSQYFIDMLQKIPESRQMIAKLDTTDDFEDTLEIAAALQVQVMSYEVPIALKKEIVSQIESLRSDTGFAVRSSASIEDRADISFAGQAESFLCVSGIDSIFNAVKRVWSSVLSPTAAIYLKTKGIPIASVRMGAVVQEMVSADIAGVMFTANVVERNLDQILIESTWGLGESLVSGKVVPDSFIVEKSTKSLVSKSLGTKEITFQYRKYEAIKTPTTSEKRERFTLSEDAIKKITQIGLDIEHMMGTPQDIEWCMKGDELLILQARPITTLNE